MLTDSTRTKQNIGIILIALIVIGIGYVIIQQWRAGQVIPAQNVNQNVSLPLPKGPPEPTFPPIPPEEDHVYSYAGRVTAADATQKIITIQTQRGEKKVSYNDKTVFMVTVQPPLEERLTMQPDELQAQITTQPASASDITVDSTIVAQNDDNIRGLTEFTANKITIIK